MKKENEKSKLLIFDFDGTIADTKSLYYRAMEDEIKFFGFSEKKLDKVLDTGMSLRKTLKNLGLGFIISFFIHRRILRRIEKYVNDVKKCRDVDAIKRIDERKIVVTNSLKEFAVPILKHLKLAGTFEKVYGAEDFSDKAEFISDYLKKNKIKKKDCYYIGDRIADIKLAKKVGCNSVAVSGKCAWNSRAEVLKENPDFLITDLADLRKIL